MTKQLLIVVTLLVHGGAAGPEGESRSRETSGTVAFLNVNVVPMDARRVVPDQTVIAADGLIRRIGPAKATSIPDGSVQIGGEGKYLMPGLVDMHVHIITENHLTLFVTSGVTTVRNMTGTPFHLAWRKRISKGELLGPTIYTAGPKIDGNPPAWPFFSAVVETPEQARRVVAQQKQAGYDFLKVFNILVEENPLEDVANVAKRVGVMVRGRWYMQSELQGMLDALAEKYGEVNPQPTAPPAGCSISFRGGGGDDPW